MQPLDRGTEAAALDEDKIEAVSRIAAHQECASTMPDSLRDLAQQLGQFAVERDWQQFHSPKNLASALAVEAGELLEHFQWMTEEQSRALSAEKRDAVGAEVADVLLYLIQLAVGLGIDPVEAAQAKLKLNALKYPVDAARGTSKKYDEL
jgi:dCTP diphosphatase